MINEFFDSVVKEFDFPSGEIGLYKPLVLAFIGDAVYEVFIRTLLINDGSSSVHKLHNRSTEYVRAKAQSDIIHRIMDNLSEEERDIVRRGRNAKSGTIPKNADVTEYKYATGFESLIGFLYLKNDQDRLMQILKMCISGDKDQE